MGQKFTRASSEWEADRIFTGIDKRDLENQSLDGPDSSTENTISSTLGQ